MMGLGSMESVDHGVYIIDICQCLKGARWTLSWVVNIRAISKVDRPRSLTWGVKNRRKTTYKMYLESTQCAGTKKWNVNATMTILSRKARMRIRYYTFDVFRFFWAKMCWSSWIPSPTHEPQIQPGWQKWMSVWRDGQWVKECERVGVQWVGWKWSVG